MSHPASNRAAYGADRPGPYLLYHGRTRFRLHVEECERGRAVPAEFGSPGRVFHARASLSRRNLSWQELGSNDRVKIVCAPPRLPQPQRRVDDCAHSGRSALDWGNAARASRRFSSGVEMRRWSSRPLHPPLHCRRQGRDDCSAPAGRSATIEIFSIRLVATPCDCADIPPAQTRVRNGH